MCTILRRNPLWNLRILNFLSTNQTEMPYHLEVLKAILICARKSSTELDKCCRRAKKYLFMTNLACKVFHLEALYMIKTNWISLSSQFDYIRTHALKKSSFFMSMLCYNYFIVFLPNFTDHCIAVALCMLQSFTSITYIFKMLRKREIFDRNFHYFLLPWVWFVTTTPIFFAKLIYLCNSCVWMSLTLLSSVFFFVHVFCYGEFREVSFQFQLNFHIFLHSLATSILTKLLLTNSSVVFQVSKYIRKHCFSNSLLQLDNLNIFYRQAGYIYSSGGLGSLLGLIVVANVLELKDGKRFN